jgi:hypothetical protein
VGEAAYRHSNQQPRSWYEACKRHIKQHQWRRHKGKYKAIGSSRTMMKNHTAILGLEFILKNRALVLGLSVFEISYKICFICSVK